MRIATKNAPAAEMHAKPQKVNDWWMASQTFAKLKVTTKQQIQLKRQAMEVAGPLMADGKISPIIIQGIGPKPRENTTINDESDVTGSHPILDTSTPFS